MSILRRAIRTGLLVLLWLALTVIGLVGVALAGIIYLAAFIIGLPIVVVLFVGTVVGKEVSKCFHH